MWAMWNGHLFAPVVVGGFKFWECRGCGDRRREGALFPDWRCGDPAPRWESVPILVEAG